MKKFILSALAIAVIGASSLVIMGAAKKSAKSSTETITKTLSLGNFRDLEVSQIKVELTQAPAGQATLAAPSDIIDRIVIEQDRDEVKIYVKDNKFGKSNVDATLTVSSNAVTDIEAECAAIVNINGELRSADDIDLSASTAGTINAGTVSSRDLDIESSTAGTVNVKRIVTSGKLDAEASTAGTVNIKGGVANYAKLEASTAGTVNAMADFKGGKAEASTGGTINAHTANLYIESNAGGSVNSK